MKKTAKMTTVFILCLMLASVAMAKNYNGKKILYVDSYHEGYPWSDEITKSIKTAFGATGARLEVFRMDTKRNKSKQFKEASALKAKSLIETYRPDVVIASDDNASKYLLAPYFKASDIPFVFCGVNWDASEYGFPTRNITGMVEVTPVDQLIEYLKSYAAGDRVGFISFDYLTARKNADHIKNILKMDMLESFHADIDSWKRGFVELQKNVDIVIISTFEKSFIKDVDAFIQFVEQHTKVPTGVYNDFMAPYALMGFTKIGKEQGLWSAAAAMKILDGSSPADIPLARNKDGKLTVNVRIAQKLGATIPYEIIAAADQVIE